MFAMNIERWNEVARLRSKYDTIMTKERQRELALTAENYDRLFPGSLFGEAIRECLAEPNTPLAETRKAIDEIVEAIALLRAQDTKTEGTA